MARGLLVATLAAAIAATSAVLTRYSPPVVLGSGQSKRNDHAAIEAFHAHKLLAERSMLCAPVDNNCLASGLIFYEPDGECYAIASRGPCPKGYVLFVDKKKALSKIGRILGTCVKELACPDPLVTPLAYDGSCRSLKDLLEICEFGIVQNIFGETECKEDDWGSGAQDESTCIVQRPPKWRNPHFSRYRASSESNYTGRRFSCSEEEKACLRNGQLLHEDDGRCYLVGERGPCPEGQTFLVDKREALEGSGSFRGRCVDTSCPEGHVRMAYDGSCRTPDEACVICSSNEGQSPNVDIFGETACWCFECLREPFDASQPEQKGSCVFPDVLHAELPRLTPLDQLPDVPCTETESLCFSTDRIYYEKNETCQELRSTDLCAEGEWLVADREEAQNGSGRLVAACQPRPCPPGEVLMLHDGKCHAEVEVTRKVCSGRPIAFDAFGGAACANLFDRAEQLPTFSPQPGVCAFSVSWSWHIVPHQLFPCRGLHTPLHRARLSAA